MANDTQILGTPWDEGLTPEQRSAASSYGQPTRMLAGPGTGKTLAMTRHILYLVQEHGVMPDEILAITFTRSATFELAQRVRAGLGEGVGLPRVSTLHSFALSQLVKNSNLLPEFSGNLRISDDWEERWVITEDLKRLLGTSVKDVQEKFSILSSDWETLNADHDDWEQQFPDGKFLAAWNEHRGIYAYLMRNELVYRLKRALDEFGPKFELDEAKHLIVDEYQDLNRCDLAIVETLVDRGAIPFIAGDDDQSIYGFRQAFPLAIRNFPKEHVPCLDPRLTICKRCDESILALGLFVAELDYEREPKEIEPEQDRPLGTTAILRFDDQYAEANGIAHLCQKLILDHDLSPHDILILLRSDANGAFSRVLIEAFNAADIEVAAATGDTPLGTATGRQVLSILRLAQDPNDSLALRTVLHFTTGVGDKTFDALYSFARSNDISFGDAARQVVGDPSIVDRGGLVADACKRAWQMAEELFKNIEDSAEPSVDELLDHVRILAEVVGSAPDELDELIRYVEGVVRPARATDLPSLFHALQSADDDIEQTVEFGKVNILTMHKAKGLTADAVFVVACEDGLIPGRNEGELKRGDERRLLYVSLTRARRYLFATYCSQRFGQQSFSGRDGDDSKRLTRFLRDAPVAPTEGATYSLGSLASMPA